MHQLGKQGQNSCLSNLLRFATEECSDPAKHVMNTLTGNLNKGTVCGCVPKQETDLFTIYNTLTPHYSHAAQYLETVLSMDNVEL